jgi:HPt (histidine-containing phosphotransfer) domain-containing protein
MNAPPTQPSGGEPVKLDDAALARLRELDPDGRHGVVARVLTAFESSLQRQLAQLAADPAAVTMATLAGVAHTLKSSSASVGATRLAHACEDIERRARGAEGSAQRHDLEWLLAEGGAALDAVRAILRA